MMSNIGKIRIRNLEELQVNTNYTNEEKENAAASMFVEVVFEQNTPTKKRVRGVKVTAATTAKKNKLKTAQRINRRVTITTTEIERNEVTTTKSRTGKKKQNLEPPSNQKRIDTIFKSCPKTYQIEKCTWLTDKKKEEPASSIKNSPGKRTQKNRAVKGRKRLFEDSDSNTVSKSSISCMTDSDEERHKKNYVKRKNKIATETNRKSTGAPIEMIDLCSDNEEELAMLVDVNENTPTNNSLAIIPQGTDNSDTNTSFGEINGSFACSKKNPILSRNTSIDTLPAPPPVVRNDIDDENLNLEQSVKKSADNDIDVSCLPNNIEVVSKDSTTSKVEVNVKKRKSTRTKSHKDECTEKKEAKSTNKPNVTITETKCATNPKRSKRKSAQKHLETAESAEIVNTTLPADSKQQRNEEGIETTVSNLNQMQKENTTVSVQDIQIKTKRTSLSLSRKHSSKTSSHIEISTKENKQEFPTMSDSNSNVDYKSKSDDSKTNSLSCGDSNGSATIRTPSSPSPNLSCCSSPKIEATLVEPSMADPTKTEPITTGTITAEPTTSKKSIKKKRPCPPYKVVAGTNFAVDGFQYGRIEGVTHYFLTHFHSDHYVGLNRSFDLPLFMSPVTANLVRKFIPPYDDHIHELELNKPEMIDDIQVTAIDANHCPGAVMFVFKLPDGKTILHTGDFRACPDMESEPIFWNNDIDTIYLDTTYISDKYAFCTQYESIEKGKEIITKFQEKHAWKRILYVCGAYVIGKEKFWSSLAQEFQLKVWADKKRKEAIEAMNIEEYTQLLFDNPLDADMHIIAMGSLSYNGLLEYFETFKNQYDVLLAFRPSGWEKNSKPQYRGVINIVGIEYSEHSSYEEMQRFVKYLKPKEVISTVPCGNDLMVTSKVPEKWYKYKELTSMLRNFQPSITNYLKVRKFDKLPNKETKRKYHIATPNDNRDSDLDLLSPVRKMKPIDHPTSPWNSTPIAMLSAPGSISGKMERKMLESEHESESETQLECLVISISSSDSN